MSRRNNALPIKDSTEGISILQVVRNSYFLLLHIIFLVKILYEFRDLELRSHWRTVGYFKDTSEIDHEG